MVKALKTKEKRLLQVLDDCDASVTSFMDPRELECSGKSGAAWPFGREASRNGILLAVFFGGSMFASRVEDYFSTSSEVYGKDANFQALLPLFAGLAMFILAAEEA